MKPLEWRESEHVVGKMLVAEPGPQSRCYVWYSERNDAWCWEVESFWSEIDYAPTEEEAKKAAESYFRGIIQMFLGDGAK